MRQPFHPISASQGPSPERVVGIGFVVLLHVVALWALISGLAQQILKAVPPDISVVFVHTPEPPKTTAPPLKVTLPTLSTPVMVQPPVINIAHEAPIFIPTNPTPPLQPTQPSPPDSAAMGVSGTHSIPPYPDLARRLNEQGRVTLRLTISPQGAVTGADIERSSGFDDLDQTAVSWVLAHWRYKPAIQGGVPVTSTIEAVVVFDLKDAR